MEAVLMVGYTSDGISNQEQTRWLSWSIDRGLRLFDLARNPGLGITTEYCNGKFPRPTRPTTRTGIPISSNPTSMIRAQQTEEAYRDTSRLNKELERTQCGRD